MTKSAAMQVERLHPQGLIGNITQRHRHLLAPAVNLDVAEELHAGRWRHVLPLLLARRRRGETFDRHHVLRVKTGPSEPVMV